MENNSSAGEKFQKLVEIMARLRAPGGCPWDREQTFDSIKPYTLEETYEVLDAIDRRAWSELAEELGDFMLQAVFYAQMASEEKLFEIGDALDAINSKLIRRHQLYRRYDFVADEFLEARRKEIKRPPHAASHVNEAARGDAAPRHMPANRGQRAVGRRLASAVLQLPVVELPQDRAGADAETQIVGPVDDLANRATQPSPNGRDRLATQAPQHVGLPMR